MKTRLVYISALVSAPQQLICMSSCAVQNIGQSRD